MSSRCKGARRGCRTVALILGAVLLHCAEGAPVRLCVDETSPAARVDARIARAVLETQQQTVEEVPFVGHGKQADDGFPLRKFAQLATSSCDLIVGFPVDVGSPHLPPDVLATEAYASTGFMIVSSGKSATRELADLKKGSEVGIAQLDTWAGLLFTTHPNIVMHVYVDDDEMLDDLAHHKITAGLTWQSYLQSYAAAHKSAELNSRMLAGPHMVWNLVALYAPTSQATADVFNRGIAALHEGNRLDAMVKPYQPAATVAPTPGGAASTASIAPSKHRVCDTPAKPHKGMKKSDKPPALYTDAQSTAGGPAYFSNCSMCHGPLLDGQKGGYSGPALKGADFADPSYDFHVDEIFHFVAKQMPAATPGSLTNELYVDIMAYILQQNGYPAGPTELTYDGAMKSRVPIRYYGK